MGKQGWKSDSDEEPLMYKVHMYKQVIGVFQSSEPDAPLFSKHLWLIKHDISDSHMKIWLIKCRKDCDSTPHHDIPTFRSHLGCGRLVPRMETLQLVSTTKAEPKGTAF